MLSIPAIYHDEARHSLDHEARGVRLVFRCTRAFPLDIELQDRLRHFKERFKTIHLPYVYIILGLLTLSIKFLRSLCSISPAPHVIAILVSSHRLTVFVVAANGRLSTATYSAGFKYYGKRGTTPMTFLMDQCIALREWQISQSIYLLDICLDYSFVATVSIPVHTSFLTNFQQITFPVALRPVYSDSGV